MNKPWSEADFERRFGLTLDEAIAEQHREFASFTPEAQMHILRSLEIADSLSLIVHPWAVGIAARIDPDRTRFTSTLHQLLAGNLAGFYQNGALDKLRASIPKDGDGFQNGELIGLLVTAAIFELTPGLIDTFPHFRFLYSRLVGSAVVPFLPSAFLATVTLPRWDAEWSQAAVRTVEPWDEYSTNVPPVFFPTTLLPKQD